MQQNSVNINPHKDAAYWHSSFLAFAKANQPTFVVDRNNEEVINQLCFFFARDARFIGNLRKGIYLAGPVGTGKTFTMKVFMRIARDLYHKEKTEPYVRYTSEAQQLKEPAYISTLKIVEDYALYGSLYHSFFNDLNHFIDDLGAEPFDACYMGNKLSVMAHLIARRYDVSPSDHRQLFFTGNLGKSQIEAVYGQRIKSRFVEMVNFIELLGEDRRK